MNARVYISFTEDENIIYQSVNVSGRVLLTALLSLIRHIKTNGIIPIYDVKNLASFLEKYEEFSEIGEPSTYFSKFRTQLQVFLGSNSIDCNNISLKNGTPHIYYWVNETSSIGYASRLLHSAYEYQSNPDSFALLVNPWNNFAIKRAFLPIFADAVHEVEHPSSFSRFPIIDSEIEFDEWYKEHVKKSFSLYDTKLFQRTNIECKGAKIYKSLSTGYYWYIDTLHRDHYEVMDSDGNHLSEANLQTGAFIPDSKDKQKKITL